MSSEHVSIMIIHGIMLQIKHIHVALYTMRGLGCPKALFVSQLDRSLEASTNDKRGNSFLLTRLRDETSTQISKFYKLLNTLHQSMMLRNIPLEELASTLLMQLPAVSASS